MYINFEKVIIHNFLSYGHSEIDLRNKEYCLVRGINNNPLDNALSNGAGKSSWSSAICWCLTGETINGLRSNLKNIFIDEKECYVTLYFTVDKDKFEVTRYIEPKSDLRLYVNGDDKSGKGIRETSIKLAEYLPDLTSQLLGSIIILGQGLPCKFTANTPSGRKEVLEKLSKSDFMIQDIKEKLNRVLEENNSKLRGFEDTLIAKTSEKNIYITQKETYTKKLEELQNPKDFTSLISEMENNINEQQNLLKSSETIISEANSQLLQVGTQINELVNKSNEQVRLESEDYQNKQKEVNAEKLEIQKNYDEKHRQITEQYNSEKIKINDEFSSEKIRLKSEIGTLNSEILRLDSIKDICPTCGQKLINVTKPDTTQKKAQLKTLQETLNTLNVNENTRLTEATNTYNTSLKDIQQKYHNYTDEVFKKELAIKKLYDCNINIIKENLTKDTSELNSKYKNLKDKISLYEQDKRIKEAKLLEFNKNLTNLKLERDSYQSKLKEVKDSLLSIDNKLKQIDEEILYNNNEKSLLENRIAIDNKINSLVKRDFRGFLLSNIINFIDKKAKEYSNYIFGSDNLNFILDGNNIEISYLNKSFENLSGGEKQKVDLIIQFAIRDMMSEYLQFSSNILILDEIFDNLDSSGCNNVINLISKKLNDVESLFIISHHADELEISYDCEMIVEKDSNGISRVM